MYLLLGKISYKKKKNHSLVRAFKTSVHTTCRHCINNTGFIADRRQVIFEQEFWKCAIFRFKFLAKLLPNIATRTINYFTLPTHIFIKPTTPERLILKYKYGSWLNNTPYVIVMIPDTYRYRWLNFKNKISRC